MFVYRFRGAIIREVNGMVFLPVFDHLCLFHALLHHSFVCLLKHIAVVLGREKLYLLEFVTNSISRGLQLLLRTKRTSGDDGRSIQS